MYSLLAGLKEAQLMMAKIGLLSCRGYIQQHREAKDDDAVDAFKPIADLTDGTLARWDGRLVLGF
jgi:hypothetical protein